MPPGVNLRNLQRARYITITKPRIVEALKVIDPDVIDKIGTVEQDKAVENYLISEGYHERQSQLVNGMNFYEKDAAVFGMSPRGKTPSPGFHYSYAKLQNSQKKEDFIFATEEHYQPKILKSVLEPILQTIGGLAIIGGFCTFPFTLIYAMGVEAEGIKALLPLAGSMSPMFLLAPLAFSLAENLDKKRKRFNEFNPKTGVDALETIAGIEYSGCGHCSACD